MILHLSRMRRNVNRKVYNDRKNVSATTHQWQCHQHYCAKRAERPIDKNVDYSV